MKHPSQRGWFGAELYKQMKADDRIYLITCDLGYVMFDDHFDDFPDRTFNVGASEQAAIGIAVGLALEGKIPVVYSITNFVLYRPFEFIRNYLDHEGVAVKIVGAGRGKDYGDDGYTHQVDDLDNVLACFPNIEKYSPNTKEEVPDMVKEMLFNDRPTFINLTR